MKKRFLLLCFLMFFLPLFILPVCVKAEGDLTLPKEKKEPLASLQKDWEAVERYLLVNDEVKVESGSIDDCNASSSFIHLVFGDLLMKDGQYYSVEDLNGISYCAQNYLLTTTIPVSYDTTLRERVEVYELTLLRCENRALQEVVEKIKQRRYESIIPTLPAPLLTHLFWVNDRLILVCHALFCQVDADDLVALVREYLKQQPPMEPPSLDYAMALSLAEAYTIYGPSIAGYLGKDVAFLLSDPMPEFRVELLNVYTKEQRAEGQISLKEVTWSIDDTHNLTVWYERVGAHYLPKWHKRWDKACEF